MVAIFFYRMAALLTRLLPVSVSYWLAERAGELMFLVRFDRRRAVLDNLHHAFGDQLSGRQLCSLSRRTFRNFAKTVVDFLRLPSLSKESIREIIGDEWRVPLLEEWRRGRGVVFLTAHLGNWELGGVAVASAGIPLTVVALDHPTEQVTEFFERRRSDKGLIVLSMREAPRGMLTALRRGDCVALLGDRDFSDRGMGVPLFGEDVPIPTGAVRLAMKTGASLFMAFAVRVKGARHRILFEGPLRLVKTGSETEDLRANVLLTLEVLERYVRKYPDQWFVFEPLWRS